MRDNVHLLLKIMEHKYVGTQKPSLLRIQFEHVFAKGNIASIQGAFYLADCLIFISNR